MKDVKPSPGSFLNIKAQVQKGNRHKYQCQQATRTEKERPIHQQFGNNEKVDPNGQSKRYLTKGQRQVCWVAFDALIEDYQT